MKRPFQPIKQKKSWEKEVTDIMYIKAKTVKPYKRPVGIGFDIDNIEFVNNVRGVLSFSEYINGIVTALREYHNNATEDNS